jgi:hypothetical protein
MEASRVVAVEGLESNWAERAMCEARLMDSGAWMKAECLIEASISSERYAR